MVEAVRDVAVLEVVEGDEVGMNDTRVLKRAGLFPADGLAGGGKVRGTHLGLNVWDICVALAW